MAVVDLDNDNQDEAFVTTGCSQGNNCTYDLYLSAAGYAGGGVVANDVMPLVSLPPRPTGFLAFSQPDACHQYIRHFTYGDNHQYAGLDPIDCNALMLADPSGKSLPQFAASCSNGWDPQQCGNPQP
jgi:hypothetical protein